MKTDTIAAIATAMGGAGLGVIRISGPEAVSIADRVFIAKNPDKKLVDCNTYTMHYGHIYDGDECIDEVIVLLMKAPRSYTAEDTVEIDCHGGVLVMRRILEAVIKNGARVAEPGEFTKRAFLNGRIDLTQAESVMDVIHAKNEFALKSSMKQLNGSLKKTVEALRKEIIHETAFIEAALDDPEHYELDSYGDKLKPIVDNLIEKIDKLLANADNGKILKEGIDTVIVGKPNVGKSSLLNVLTKSNRAIVTDIAGTTRDVLEEQMNLDGITLNVIDTAGIHDTDDVVEKIGVDRAKEYLDASDLVIYVADASRELDEDDDHIIGLVRNKNVIILLNKTDLDKATTDEMLKAKFGEDAAVIEISAKHELGIELIEEQIKKMFFHGEISFNDEVYITNMRHKSALMNAVSSLKLVLDSIEAMVPEDFYTVDLLNAYEELGFIIGESITDDLVNEIFHEFCMGK